MNSDDSYDSEHNELELKERMETIKSLQAETELKKVMQEKLTLELKNLQNKIDSYWHKLQPYFALFAIIVPIIVAYISPCK